MKIMEDTDLMPFGKHKGTELKNVPADYLLWLRDESGIALRSPFRRYIERNRKVLEAERDGRA